MTSANATQTVSEAVSAGLCVNEGCGGERLSGSSKYGKVFYYPHCRRCYGENVSRRWAEKQGRPFALTRREQPDGYVLVKREGRWIGEHRVVMEQTLGRSLRKGESVHHINGIRNDNRPENLELWVGPIRYGQRATQVHCPHCGKSYMQAEMAGLNVGEALDEMGRS